MTDASKVTCGKWYGLASPSEASNGDWHDWVPYQKGGWGSKLIIRAHRHLNKGQERIDGDGAWSFPMERLCSRRPHEGERVCLQLAAASVEVAAEAKKPEVLIVAQRRSESVPSSPERIGGVGRWCGVQVGRRDAESRTDRGERRRAEPSSPRRAACWNARLLRSVARETLRSCRRPRQALVSALARWCGRGRSDQAGTAAEVVERRRRGGR